MWRDWLLLVLVTLSSTGGALQGQQRPELRVSPVPVWDGEGYLPPPLQNEPVFLDPARGELIVVAGRGPDGVANRLVRFELRNRIEALISAQVSQAADGLYVYEYRISAGKRSQDKLAEVGLFVPVDPEMRKEAPAGWEIIEGQADAPDRFVPGPGLLRIVRFSARRGSELIPGQGTATLRLVSRHSPGYVTAFAWSVKGSEVPAERFNSLPEPTAQRVKQILASHWNAWVHTTLGPRFAPGTSPLLIAAALHHSIQHLVASQRLDDQSDFVRQALSGLWGMLESGMEAPLTTANLPFLDAARTPAEKEVAQVLRLSLAGVSEGR